jgi:NAD(P)-dependent dehydrogenase (short-subunit alcohol dehydrogenase family)
LEELGFDGRAVIVTGAGRGLGKGYALLLAVRGAKVVVNDSGGSVRGEGSDAGAAEQVVEEIRAAGGTAVASVHSVATPEGGQAIVDTAIAHFGRLDALIHNAGISRPAPIDEMPVEDFRAVLDVHIGGAFHLVRAAMPVMRDAGYGRILLTTSTGGLYGSARQASYGAAKTAMMGLSNITALEGAAHGIHCNTIAPGAVTRISEGYDTGRVPVTMRPEVVAPLAAWLVHESCAVTGESFISMAGRIARFVLAETEGVFAAEWTPEAVAAQADRFRDTDKLMIFPVIPQGHADHIDYSFAMARAAGIGCFAEQG